MKTVFIMFAFLFISSCALSPTQGFLDQGAHQNNVNAANGAAFAGQAATNAANAASMQQMMHTPPPSGF